MGKLVEIIGVTHTPFLPKILAEAEAGSTAEVVRDEYAWMREKLADAKPDLIITVASDHLNQWFTDNMPAFLVGKSASAQGPFPHEMKNFGLAPYEAQIDQQAATCLVEEGWKARVDLAFTDEFRMDHAFTVPLNFVRPEADVPIVPIFTNVMAVPVPPPLRFYQVGEALRSMIEALPGDKRVAVVSSGHLSVELGGPKMGRGPADLEFDNRMMEIIGSGDYDTLLKEATPERMLQAGNVTAGFLNYILLCGVSNGKAPTDSGVHYLGGTLSSSTPHMAWDVHKEVGAR
jgi:protocatechuate 4,5-dioxygenase, beta chain